LTRRNAATTADLLGGDPHPTIPAHSRRRYLRQINIAPIVEPTERRSSA
jgi:hypothetical protein